MVYKFNESYSQLTLSQQKRREINYKILRKCREKFR